MYHTAQPGCPYYGYLIDAQFRSCQLEGGCSNVIPCACLAAQCFSPGAAGDAGLRQAAAVCMSSSRSRCCCGRVAGKGGHGLPRKALPICMRCRLFACVCAWLCHAGPVAVLQICPAVLCVFVPACISVLLPSCHCHLSLYVPPLV